MEERSAGVIVFRQEGSVNKYLLLKHPSVKGGHWDFPKGHIEEGEEPLQAAKRELKEETGIKIAGFIDGFTEEIEYTYKKEGEMSHKKVLFFLAMTGEEDIELSFEHVDFEWLSYDEALKRITYNNSKEALRKAHELYKQKNLEQFF